MAGQVDWKDAGKGDVNNFIVNAEIVASIEAKATAASLFGKLNAGRVADTEITGGGGKTVISSGKESPVHEKTLSENNTAKFTLEEELEGMPTYGDAPVKPGDYQKYLHATIEARTISSPGFPIMGFESADNAKRVIPMNDLVSRKKAAISTWMNREFDLDGLRAYLYGLSRGLYMREDGGKGTQLNGTDDATRWRAPWNTFVDGVGQDGLTPQSAASAATHNNNLGALLNTLSPGNPGQRFRYETHDIIDKLIDQIRLRSVKILGEEFRAVVLMDMRNLYSLRRDPELRELWMKATPRSDKNFAIFSRDYHILDNILYLPVEILKWFRPTVNQSTGEIVRFGCGFDLDPRSPTFRNDSNITMSIVLGAGALRRGRRKYAMKFTEAAAPHDKGKEIAVHWDDGWMRNEWFSKDGGTPRMHCDTSFTVFNADDGAHSIKV
jgi:hypothetical protein